MSRTKTVLATVFVVALVGAGNFFYHPSNETFVFATVISILLLGLVTWSSFRFGKGGSAILKTIVVAGVAAFMLTQALDVIYVLRAAPLGGRLAMLPELLVFTLIIWGSARFITAVFSRPQKKQ